MQELKRILSNHLVNMPGLTSQQKTVVIESDDWGSTRMPSVQAYENLLSQGIAVQKSPYCKYDNLCSPEDLALWFEVLGKHRDSLGNHPIITANVVVGNPDFDKIKASDYQTYFFETIDKTFDRYFPNNSPLNYWKKAMDEKLFLPQFHGREHVNVPFWLDKLQKNDSVFCQAFAQGCSGISTDVYQRYPKSVQASFDYDDVSELEFMRTSITEGLQIFEQLFGFRSKSFIPNNYIWPSELDDVLTQNGIEIMQGFKYQLLPKPKDQAKRKMLRRKHGQKINGLLQTVRNVQFEPSLLHEHQKNSVVAHTLNQIATSFLWKKPAVITMHRINFCGSLHTSNRDLNLRLFDQLLSEITKRWPDVVFTDTVSLAQNINKSS